jgi:hypothetical protein
MTTEQKPVKRGRGRPRKSPPKNAATLIYNLSLKRPTIGDIAAGLNIDKRTLHKWLADNRDLQMALDRARADLTEQVMAAQIGKATAGDDKAAKQVIQAFRPDLAQPENVVNVNVDSRSINVLPAPAKLETLVTDTTKVIDHKPVAPPEGTAARVGWDLHQKRIASRIERK